VVGLGLVWGLVRRSTRPIAWLAIGFFLAFLFATFEGFYTLTTDRRSIFTFPVFICLGVMGVHALTEWLPGREVLRLAIGLGTAAFALWAPIHVRYWPVTDVRLIQQTSPADADALVLTPAAVYLAAYYGPWPFTVERSTQVGGVRIMRSRTAVALDPDQVEHFVAAAHAGRVWFVSFRTADALEDGVVGILRAQGYEVEAVEHTTRGTLFVGSQP
jgi:hypothetical protein